MRSRRYENPRPMRLRHENVLQSRPPDDVSERAADGKGHHAERQPTGERLPSLPPRDRSG